MSSTPPFEKFNQPCILMVDDHQLFRTGMRMIVQSFEGMGRVLEAGTVMQARALAHEPVDVIFLDVQMPGLSGLQGLAVLQSCFAKAKIIFLSASTTVQALQDTASQGAKGYLPKSASAQDIEHALRQVLSGGTCFTTPPATHTMHRIAQDGLTVLALPEMTVRQKETLALLAQGLPNKVIARQLNLSENTVRVHVGAVLAYFGVNSRTAAVLAAQQAGLVDRINSPDDMAGPDSQAGSLEPGA